VRARAGHVALNGVLAARVVGHLAEVPAFAVQVDLLSIDTVGRRRQGIECARSFTMLRFM